MTHGRKSIINFSDSRPYAADIPSKISLEGNKHIDRQACSSTSVLPGTGARYLVLLPGTWYYVVPLPGTRYQVPGSTGIHASSQPW